MQHCFIFYCYLIIFFTITQPARLIDRRPFLRRIIPSPLPCFSHRGAASRTPELGMEGGMAIGAQDFAALAAFGALGFISQDFITENPGLRGSIGFTPSEDPLLQQAMVKYVAQL